MNCDNIDCDTINGDYITCIDLTSTGSINGNNIGATGITTTNINSDTGEFTGVLIATNNTGSTVSKANQIFTTASTTNTNFPISFSSSGGGYKDILNSTTLTYNPSTQVINVSGLTASGKLTATNDASSIVSNSNAVYTVGVTSGSYYVPLISNSGGTGYRNLYNKSSITYDMTNDIFNCGKGQLTLGDWNTDDPSLVLGTSDGNKEGVLEIIASATTSYLLEGTPSGNFELYYKLSGTSYLLYQITSTVYNVYADMNLSTGKSYKINGVALNTDNIQESGTPTNKYYTDSRARSSITPTNTSEINHTYSTSTGILTSNINATSVTNAMLAGSIANAKLTNSSISLNGTSMSLGGTYTIPATGTITLGTTAMSLGNTYTTIAGGTPNITYTTFSLGIPITTYYTINASASLKFSSLLRIEDFFIQSTPSKDTYLDSYQTAVGNSPINASINIGTLLPNQKTVIGSSLASSTVQITSSSFTNNSIKCVASGVDIPYNNVKFAKLGTGTKSTALISPNWQRVENASGSSILEVTFYPYSTSGTLKLEASIATFYTSTNTGTNFNIQVLKNSVSTTTVSSSTNMVHSLWFNRNIIAVNATYLIPLLGTYTFTGGTVGDYYTISVYFQSFTTFASGSTVGRATDDIPTTLVVTQIA
jgi:hypothetical protein